MTLHPNEIKNMQFYNTDWLEESSDDWAQGLCTMVDDQIEGMEILRHNEMTNKWLKPDMQNVVHEKTLRLAGIL